MSKKSVLVAMSGGVDSSVSAAILKEKGVKVTGIGLRLLDEKIKKIQNVAEGCCGKEGFKDAKNVAGKLGIPFFILDASRKFKKTVVDYFINSYLSGYTPNPCIVCNEKIKFDILLDHAKSLGIDYIATGHYCLIRKRNKEFNLYKGRDIKKEQSYFLYTLNQGHLKKILFPVGNLLKSETRKLARKYRLPVADKKESQDICFLENKGYDKFLESFIGKKIKKGPIKDQKGMRIGTHNGFIRYTVGQRRGLGMSNPYPLYVSRILPEENTLVAGAKKDILRKKLNLEKLNWVNHPPLGETFRAFVKIRSNHTPSAARIFLDKKKAIVKFDKAQFAITPGQAAVFYINNKLIGGGWIAKDNGY